MLNTNNKGGWKLRFCRQRWWRVTAVRVMAQPLTKSSSFQMEASTGQVVVLREVELATSGRYKCEVLAEAPAFNTLVEHAILTVVGRWLCDQSSHFISSFSLSCPFFYLLILPVEVLASISLPLAVSFKHLACLTPPSHSNFYVLSYSFPIILHDTFSLPISGSLIAQFFIEFHCHLQ